MHARKALILIALVLLAATLPASGRSSTTLRISMTVLERCDIGGDRLTPDVACSRGVAWSVATRPASAAGSGDTQAMQHPVPADVADERRPLTTIVF